MAQFAIAIAVSMALSYGLSKLNQVKPDVPRLDDLNAPKSAYGAAIPYIYGKYRIGGNIIWAEDIKEHHEGGGKGKPTPEAYTYTGTFAAMFCEGEVELRRVFLNGTKVYDFYDTSNDGKELNENFWDYAEFKNGSANQDVIARMTLRDGVVQTPAYRGYAYVFFQDLPLEDYGNTYPQVSAEVESVGTTSVAECVKSICLKSGLAEDYFDVSQLSGDFIGFALKQSGATYREYLEQLQQAYHFYCKNLTAFDGVGKPIQFVPYASTPFRAGTFDADSLGLTEDSKTIESAVLVERRNETELPSKVVLSFLNQDKEFEVDSFETIASRLADGDTAIDITTDLVLNLDAARTATTLLLHQSHARKDSYTFIVPSFTKIDFNPGDVVGVTYGHLQNVPIQIQKIVYGVDFSAEVSGTFFSPFSGQVTSTPQTPRPQQPSSFYGAVTPILADTSLIKATDSPLGIFIGASTVSRMGESLIQISSNNGESYKNVGTLTAKIIVGTIRDALPSASPYVIDRANRLLVTVDGNLSSVPDDAFMQKRNLALIGGELVSFRDAVAITPNVYELSHLIRYCNGTVGANYTHVAGERFMLLSGEGTRYLRPEGDISLRGKELLVKIQSQGGAIAQPVAITPNALGAKPSRVANLSARHNDTGEVVVNWFRTYHLGDDWVNGVETPAFAANETTHILINRVSNPLPQPIEYKVKTNSFTYTTATADFGTSQALKFVVFNELDGVVNGYESEVSL